MHITLRQLEIFRAVAQSDRVTAAAESLYISQPAASMALSELEKHLGPLFDRHSGASMTLNDAGRALLPMATEMLDRAGEIESQFMEGGCYEQGTVRICASSTIGNNLMPHIIGGFKKTCPNIRTEIQIDNSRNIKQRLLSMEVDLAVVEGSCLHPDLEAIAWQEDELVIICSPGHPLSGQTVELKDLTEEHWILRERGSGTRALFDEVLAVSLKTPPSMVMSLNRAEAVKQAVMAGLGIGCISHLAVWRAKKAGLISTINVKELALKRHFYLLLNKRRYKSGVVQKLSEFILAWEGKIPS
ncbi:LysR substrate-binding domain-containing protein [Endozoicomonas sp. OPT23]|uniref:LysR substrate-binding domain-containing protein n=1 Tax=Endozoicomonas sp. OPT23 TaxID=2072845 RepID=UPI0018912C22|nr:LysR substrate-binding domain-containing protein [Endozoicomonas sp. OPT23]